MGIFNTRPRFDDIQIKQLSGDTITLSGTTNISGTFRYLPGATVGYVLKAIDSSGTVGWQPVSVSADTNTFVTGGTLNGSNQLILNWNTGGSASAIDLSSLSDTTYWTAGTSGTGSIRVTNGGGTNATGSYAVAQGLNTTASGDYSHSEGNSTIASGTASHSGGLSTIAGAKGSKVSGTNSTVTASGYYSFIHSNSSFINKTNAAILGGTNNQLSGDADRSVVLGGTGITGLTTDTVYTPNLTVRGDYILHSNSTLEVVDIPTSFESSIKGSYTEFNWDGITTNLISNSNPSGYTAFLLGNITTYPTVLNHGFLSYYGTGYTRTGTPATGNEFYRNKMVLKTAGDSAGTIFSNANPIGEWQWELNGNSRMVLTNKGELGLGLNFNGAQNPSEMLHVNGGDILVTNTNGQFYTDIQNSAGPLTLLSGTTTELPRFAVKTPTYDSVTFGIRGGSEPSFPGYGKQGDAFIYSSADNNGFNIVSQPGTGTDDYIRFFVGQAAGASGTPDLYIQGSGTTRGNIGINNETPTSKLDILGTNGYQQLRLRTNYTPSSTADTNGEIGDIAWDNSYLYIKTGTGWGRLALDYVF